MKSVRHRDGQPESQIEAFGLRIHIDRHEGTVLEGTGPDGVPYRVEQRVPYGYLPGVKGDDGEPYDVYVGPERTVDRVHVVRQMKAGNGRYDEQKAMLGFASSEAAEECFRAHTHPRMFGRMGSLSLDAFRAQLAAHPGGVFRAETDEDADELAEMQAAETELREAGLLP